MGEAEGGGFGRRHEDEEIVTLRGRTVRGIKPARIVMTLRILAESL
jgi:hypothetical protein